MKRLVTKRSGCTIAGFAPHQGLLGKSHAATIIEGLVKRSHRRKAEPTRPRNGSRAVTCQMPPHPHDNLLQEGHTGWAYQVVSSPAETRSSAHPVRNAESRKFLTNRLSNSTTVNLKKPLVQEIPEALVISNSEETVVARMVPQKSALSNDFTLSHPIQRRSVKTS